MDRPILMNREMVRAVLSGQKTQIRQPIKDGPEWRVGGRWTWTASSTDRKAEGCFNYSYPDPNGNMVADRGREKTVFSKRCPMGLAGDRLWVRETFIHQQAEYEWTASVSHPIVPSKTIYRADCREDSDGVGWTPSIHMPRWASRITLPLVSVRVERLHDIDKDDILAEGLRRTDRGWTDGVTGYDTVSALDAFRELWVSIYGQQSWDANPWVWVAEWSKAEVRR